MQHCEIKNGHLVANDMVWIQEHGGRNQAKKVSKQANARYLVVPISLVLYTHKTPMTIQTDFPNSSYVSERCLRYFF